jgi:hypothetical protein|tara:strand:+ start:3362 stop:3556 length:195 start_codon:yes stop_codon:yes gene_type:complete
MGDEIKKVVGRMKSQVYKLKHRRIEGFVDNSLLSSCLINEIKYLFSMMDETTQREILNKSWLDD